MSRPYIGCPLLQIAYDFDKRAVCLFVPQDACVDMDSAGKYVEAVFPDVLRIHTVAESLDTGYIKNDGVWTPSLGLKRSDS